jgi:hypothetical protein
MMYVISKKFFCEEKNQEMVYGVAFFMYVWVLSMSASITN